MKKDNFQKLKTKYKPTSKLKKGRKKHKMLSNTQNQNDRPWRKKPKKSHELTKQFKNR